MRLKSLERLINLFNRFPSIGPKTAEKIALYLISLPNQDINQFIEILKETKERIKKCPICHVLMEDLCVFCENPQRDSSIICVVEKFQDIFLIEKTQIYRGFYHVLGGLISPLDGISPKDLNIESLIKRISKGNIEEVIFALSYSTEAGVTLLYLTKELKKFNIKLSKLAYGIPAGADLSSLNEETLSKALENRQSL